MQCAGFMPRRSIANKHNIIFRIRCCQVLQKDIHANSIAVRQNQKAGFPRQRLYRSIYISVFPNMMARHRRSHPFSAPTVFRLVDAAKTGFILKHQPNPLGIVENFPQFVDPGVNFFEASIASGSALFGCLLLGSFFVHPCRCST